MSDRWTLRLTAIRAPKPVLAPTGTLPPDRRGLDTVRAMRRGSNPYRRGANRRVNRLPGFLSITHCLKCTSLKTNGCEESKICRRKVPQQQVTPVRRERPTDIHASPSPDRVGTENRGDGVGERPMVAKRRVEACFIYPCDRGWILRRSGSSCGWVASTGANLRRPATALRRR